jgi:hypothetical protein
VKHFAKPLLNITQSRGPLYRVFSRKRPHPKALICDEQSWYMSQQVSDKHPVCNQIVRMMLCDF